MVQPSLKEQAIVTIVKQGPWAIVATSMLCFIGYEAHYFAGSVGVSVTNYVRQSGENIQIVRDLATGLSSMGVDTQAAVLANAAAIAQATETNKVSLDLLTRAVAIMQSVNDAIAAANTMMSPVPEERRKHTLLLTEIRDELQKLRSGMKVPD